MNSIYTPTQNKVVTSVALEEDVRDWIDENIPERKRSDFINATVKRYIKRHELRKELRKQEARAQKILPRATEAN